MSTNPYNQLIERYNDIAEAHQDDEWMLTFQGWKEILLKYGSVTIISQKGVCYAVGPTTFYSS